MRWKRIHDTPLADRFWKYVKKGRPNECWPFIGDIQAKGYGHFTLTYQRHFKRVRWLAHRLAWTLVHGDIPEGKHVCHKCDNPPCCNPKHLFCGTPKDNTQDMISKGRWSRPPRLQGEEHGEAKLTEKDVIEIRRLYVPWSYSAVRLSKEFHVSKRLIFNIVHRLAWKHVPQPDS